MKKVSVVFSALVLLVTLAGIASAATLKGTISDKMCGASHHGQDPAACTRSCVKNGSPFVLVISTNKILDIENQKEAKIAAELDKYAGQAVTVTGTESKDGKSVKVESIKPAK